MAARASVVRRVTSDQRFSVPRATTSTSSTLNSGRGVRGVPHSLRAAGRTRTWRTLDPNPGR